MMTGTSSNTGGKKTIEVDLNLIPFIDMLSACLSFLLLTAVWTFVGTVDTTQAIGAESTAGANNPPSVAVQMDKDNSFDFQLKDTKAAHKNFSIKARNGQPNWEKIDELLKSIKTQNPEIKTSVVLTRPEVKYGNTMRIVDALKRAEIKDVGISPM